MIASTNGATERRREYPPVDVKAIREASGMTQKAFANTYGFTLGALRDWEQGRKRPERTARILLRVIVQAPDTVARAVAGS
ncbi:helix-turn-helix domain-containing protein [Mesorhizobium xinjiangense]|uniref:helix-turn-helix domain-containing protein n=1 Tax=Mesorhizobium xinjiangense TaxID=2678685 RepID=UPI0012ECD9B8|nr:helix-turn-helix domain-containing protein [Mesorhizobium xinjiangense]